MSEIVQAIEHIQNMFETAKGERDAFEAEVLDEYGSWQSWDDQCWGEGNDREVETLSAVLDVLQSVAHGITPAQGAAA